MRSPNQYAAGFAALVLAGLALASLAPAGPVRLGALGGVGIGAVTGAAAGVLLLTSLQKTMQATLQAITLGFLGRMVGVGLGLGALRFLGADLLAAALGFFGLYIAGQLMEIGGAWSRLRPGSRSEEQKA
jgi:hypothetical protein